MSRMTCWIRGAAALALAVTTAGCSVDKDVFGVDRSNDMFQRYVALGNSITAGYQSGGINDSTQKRSYARLLALSMGTGYRYPQLANPGCPPPFVTNAGGRPTGTSGATCALRNEASATGPLNNVAVPGATSYDPATPQTPYSNVLTNLFLGGKTQVQRALEVNPTFISIWIGNNDVLSAAGSGFITPVAGVTAGITPVATFQANYDKMMAELEAGAPNAEGVLIGVVDVTNLPLFFPAALLFNAQYAGGLSQVAGTAVTPHPTSCSATSSSLISFQVISAIRAGAHPSVISCDKSTSSAATPGYGDAYVLDAQDLTALTAAVTAYNAHIEQKANAAGWAYWNPNPTLANEKSPTNANGCIEPWPNLGRLSTATGNPFSRGPAPACISLDGVHPGDRGHRIIADRVIVAINAKYGTSLAMVP